VLRTHGGAKLVEPLLYEPFRYDTSFQARELRAADQKRRIGLAAAELVQENNVIGLTAGTTTTQIGRALRHRRGITVVTNAVNIGMELCNQPEIKTMIAGGTLAWAWSFALAGQATLNFMREIYLDTAFLSVTGFDLVRGITTLEVEEAAFANTMAHQARKVVVVADSSKIGQVSHALICPISEVHVLITDAGLPQEAHDALISRGIQVVCA
jgi:DeoR family transcriptional regulator of aga operon